jgi:hypothetical protein
MSPTISMILRAPGPSREWVLIRLAGYFAIAVGAALTYAGGMAVYNAISADRSLAPHESRTPTPDLPVAPPELGNPVVLPEGPPMVQRSPAPVATKDVVPKDPSDVVGMQVFVNYRLIGRVAKITTAPSYAQTEEGVERKGTAVFIQIVDEKGTPLTIEYRNIQWKAKASSTKTQPEWGVLTAASVGDGRG